MSLAAGSKLGRYEILALIGAGGMGEVYRARDPRIARDVAIKVSAEQFSEGFEREARVIASLNHPNICTLFDVGPNYLVMELVEGPTLAERIRRGALPLEESLKIARQIATALDYAHEKPDRPVVHRDLKPANIKVRPDGTIKLLDFGLAKAGASSDGEETVTIGLSQSGVILGTPGYMAPEQARGLPVDKRADIWAFGVILWEMLTGERLFQGPTVADKLAAVLSLEPDWERVPGAARRLLRRCLERDPQRRLKAAGDMEYLLDEAPMGQAISSPAKRSRNRDAVAALVTLALAALAFVHFREKPPVSEPVRFQIPPPEKANFASAPPVVSPDGRRLAFIAGTGGDNRLWVRSLDTLEARPLAGTEGDNMATFFWSPDSRFIGFVQGTRLRKVDASGGPPQTVCDLPTTTGYRGGGWGPGGVIVFGAQASGLWRVPGAGGTASPLTKLEASRGAAFDTTPSFLPDGRHFVYFRQGAPEMRGIYLGSLDLKPERRDSKRLVAADGIAVYAPPAGPTASLGHLLFLREGSLMAQPFDANRMETSGDVFPIAEGVGNNFQNSWFSASTTGVLAYRTGGTTSGGAITQLTWFDRAGKKLGAAGDPGAYNVVTLSPDGTRAAVMRTELQAGGTGGGGNQDIWLHEFARSTTTRFTFDPARDGWPAWSPDGSRIAFSSEREGSLNLYQKVSQGGGNEDILLRSNETKFVQDWSRDGRFLIYSQGSFGTYDLWVLPLESKKPTAYLNTEFSETEGRFSPDTRFVAYSSNASGMTEIYVQPFPDASGGKWIVSKGGGAHPRWRRDGNELFYISADSKMMAVDVTLSPTFQAGIPKALFPAPILGGAGATNVTRYDVTADGQRFLMNAVGPEPDFRRRFLAHHRGAELASWVEEMTLDAGSKLGPYEILALTGAGGMGGVYRAETLRAPESGMQRPGFPSTPVESPIRTMAENGFRGDRVPLPRSGRRGIDAAFSEWPTIRTTAVPAR